jgi:hypothetical protein
MRTPSVTVSSLAAALLLAVAPVVAGAQSRTPTLSAYNFEATPYVGYMMFGDYLSGPFGTSISSAPAMVVGAELGMKLAPSLSLVGNLATASSDIQAGIPFLGGLSVAQSRVAMFDAGLQLSLPVTSAGGTGLSPFIQAGAGVMRYDITQSFLSTTSTNFAANIGAGVDIGVGRGVGVRVMAKDYIGKFDVKQAISVDVPSNTAHNVALNAGLRFSF